MLEELPPATTQSSAEAYQARFLVRRNGCVLIVRSAQIDWIEACARYCALHAGDDVYRVPGPFGQVVARLSLAHFIQASRSSLVNIERIAHLYTPATHILMVQMRNGESVRISRRFRRSVMAKLDS